MDMNSSGLKLHTRQIPEGALPKVEQAPKKRRKSVRTFSTSRFSPAERVLRNTSVACALLLTVLALRAIDTPFTNRITSALDQAISMDISLDQSLGQLSFVENIMPESALVFFHMGSSRADGAPVDGQAVHPWSKGQPWLEYQTADHARVYAVKAGTVSAASQSASGDWTVLIDHTGGSQTVYAYLAECSVSAGQQLEAGAQVGLTGEGENARLYWEYRVDSEPADPFAVGQSA